MNAKETLSAAADGECRPDEWDRLLDALGRDPELMADWSRLCAQRDAREGVRLQPGAAALTTSIMQALAAEPAPIRQHHHKVAPLRRRRPLWQPVGGFAVAASAALMAFVLVMGGEERSAEGAPTSVSAPVVLPPAPRESLRVVSNNPGDPEDAWLLLEHNNAVAGQAMGGALRYARFATHSPDVRPAVQRDEGSR
jgi:negative regulator of sigma E activity